MGEADKRNQTAYVRLINTATDSGGFEANRVRGFLPTRVCYFLMNAHTVPRKVYLCRHGRSLYNTESRIGGDSGLTAEGRRFSMALANWVRTLPEGERPAVVWTSTLQRTVNTANEKAVARWQAALGWAARTVIMHVLDLRVLEQKALDFAELRSI